MMISEAAEPLYFGKTAAPLFGWWHKPAGPLRGMGVVLCAPFGREEVSAYRSLRNLAGRLADAGLPVVRFDYAGCGDSAGDERSDRLVQAWTDSVNAAANELKQLSGVQRVAIVGLRLGATLGWQAACERDDVAALVAIVPVLSGRAFVRELKALQAASGSSGDQSTADEFMESGGYLLHLNTRDALTALDLRAPERAPIRRLLLIDRDDLPPNDEWAARLKRLNCKVAHLRLPGYVEMMQDPHSTEVPRAVVDAVTSWLVETASSFAAPAILPTRVPQQLAHLGLLTEQAVWVETATARLSGVLSLPKHLPAPRDAVLLLNAGATRRTGPSRMYVTLARHWATRGQAVLRMDMSGIGDSSSCDGAEENVVYSPTAVEEVGAAVNYLRNNLGIERCRVVGMCSGAYHAFKAAVRGTPVVGVVAINPLTFFWHDDGPMEVGMREYEILDEMARHRAGLFAANRWIRLLRGDVDVLRLGRLCGRWLKASVSSTLRDLGRTMRLPMKDDLGRELQAIVAKGINLQFLFAEGDPGEALLRTQGGMIVKRMLRSGKIQVHVVPNGDHTFTRSSARAVATSIVSDIVAMKCTDGRV